MSLSIDGRKVAVTGGGGFIGSHLVDDLLSRGCFVTVLDSFERGSTSNLPKVHEKLTIKNVNLLESSNLERELMSTEVLFDLAAKVSGNRELYQSPADLLTANIGITMNVARAAVKARIGRVVFSSSSCVYDSPAPRIPHSENDVALPLQSYYGWSKLIGETIYSAYSEQFGLKVGTARIFNAYGPRESLRSPHVIPEFIQKAFELKRGKSAFEVLGDGNQTRSFLYVRDAVSGLVKLAESDYCEVFNFGSEKEVKIVDLAELILRRVGLDPTQVSFVYEPINPIDIRRRAANTSKARTSLKWEPKISLNEGLANTIDWFTKSAAH
ncbi:MAG: NAD-dependent epimerase/dehydratase family protein [Candidatus Bathyarchaeia archaeon]